MKKIFLIVVTVLTLETINAQPQPGTTRAGVVGRVFQQGPGYEKQSGFLDLIPVNDILQNLADANGEFIALKIKAVKNPSQNLMELREESNALKHTIFVLNKAILDLKNQLLNIVSSQKIMNLRDPNLLTIKKQLQDSEIIKALEDADVMKAFEVTDKATTRAEQLHDLKKAQKVINPVTTEGTILP
jgi:hypothetical protein